MIKRMTALLSVFVLLFAVSVCAKRPGKAPEEPKRAPGKNAGIHFKTLRVTPLKGEIPSIEQAKLRLRIITVEPGGHTALHVHRNRPGIVYIVAGAVYNHPQGQPVKKVSAGEIFCETQGYTHYIENRGQVSATLISADIVTSGKE